MSLSLRSSHSSRYSSSEFSDDLRSIGPPPLPPPDIYSSLREPLPLPQSYYIVSSTDTQIELPTYHKTQPSKICSYYTISQSVIILTLTTSSVINHLS